MTDVVHWKTGELEAKIFSGLSDTPVFRLDPEKILVMVVGNRAKLYQVVPYPENRSGGGIYPAAITLQSKLPMDVFAKEERILVPGHYNEYLNLSSRKTGKLIQTIPSHWRDRHAYGLHPNQRQAITVEKSGRITLWSAEPVEEEVFPMTLKEIKREFDVRLSEIMPEEWPDQEIWGWMTKRE